MNIENIIELTDLQIQQILENVKMETLVFALKGASPFVKEKIEANMSKRACEQLNELLSKSGAVEIEKVIEAQNTILQSIRV